MFRDNIFMPLPLIPHCNLDPECCGCLLEVMEDGEFRFRCNECGAVLSREEVARLILALESCQAT